MRRAGVHGHVHPTLGKPPGERRQARLRRAHLGREVVGQERDAHATGVKGTATADEGSEAARVGRVYGDYARSRRRRRAWSAENPGNRAIRAELSARALQHAAEALSRPGLILDVGCGTGWWLERLSRLDIDPERLIGIDIQEARVDGARSRVPGANLMIGDARSLPLPARSCDLVTMFTVLSSLQTRHDVVDALRAARAVLTEHGLLLVYEPRFPNPLSRTTIWVSGGALDEAGLRPRHAEHLTVVPQVARRLGRRIESIYPRLSKAGLVTHRLVAYRPT